MPFPDDTPIVTLDDPPVQCWHIEPGTPCDWDICRQPERLAAGDYGTDPAEVAMVDDHVIACVVSTELAEAFEAHAHLLAPARIVRSEQSENNPFWCTYYLHHPDAPQGAVTVVPLWSAVFGVVRLHSLEWYDADGHLLPPPGSSPAQ